jgi:NAD(P)-dependent dehydrogenase (short-subunit alcohol dehydrogenase family)
MPTAIVTGASSGIGLAIAQALAERGYSLVVTSRSLTPSHPGFAQIGPERLAVVAGDIADADTARMVLRSGLDRFGGIDLLVNNAGIFIPKPFVDYTEQEYERLMSTNVRGFFNLTRPVLTHMLARRAGHIVNITTSLAENPIRQVPCVLPMLAKGGLNAATRALALEVAGTGVRVNAVSPGIIRTPMHPDHTHEMLATLQPMGRIGEADEIARGVLYLEDSPFVTGELLHIDGGASVGRW